MGHEEEDPLIKALPPATDYLTYLTLLEYQLTPARLPTLHRLLQDETLTTNIGWDLVQLLLPMLPESQECLEDVARLGNPREVILRVADALMKLEPQHEDTDKHDEHDECAKGDSKAGAQASSEPESHARSRPSQPLHVLQFNSLVAMLSVLHGRIKTKRPSRFIATSLQAVLEAYTSMPTDETTAAVLALLRDLSPSKRPALPPRGTSDSSVFQVRQSSAPDPEAEEQTESTSNEDAAMVRKLVQFALIEVLKSYILSLSGPTDSGLSWTLRLQETLGNNITSLTNKLSKTHIHTTEEHLRERDLIVSRITALSRDFGLKDEDLLQIVTTPQDGSPPQLDFDEMPKSPDDVPLERHGALLLLAARLTCDVLFSRPTSTRIPVYPDLATIFANFVGVPSAADAASLEHPQALREALLSLTVISTHEKIEEPQDEQQYRNFAFAVTSCSNMQSYNALRRIPSIIVRSHPSELARFKLIRHVLENEELHFARESAVGWLRDEMLPIKGEEKASIFVDKDFFYVLVPLLFNAAELSSVDLSSGLIVPWLRFSQSIAPAVHAALNLYYLLLSSPELRGKLELGKTHAFLRRKFFEPLRSLCRRFEEDLSENGGDGEIEAALGPEMSRAGMARAIGLLYQILAQVEERAAEVLDVDDDEEPELTGASAARIAEIEARTAV